MLFPPSALARATRVLLLVVLAVSLASPASARAAAEPGSRYVVYLDGLHSSGNTAAADFAAIDSGIRREPPAGLGTLVEPAVYFSYGAAVSLRQAGQYCAGWGSDACDAAGSLASPHAAPEYSADDTRFEAIDEHARALDWLLQQIVQRDASAEVHLVGISLGGIVASRWAALFGSSDGAAGRVKSIVLLGSPVGGAPDGRTPSTRLLAESLFGAVVLDALDTPADPTCATTPDNFVCSLRLAASRYQVTSIEPLDDYFVNGQELTIRGVGPRRIGLGAQEWPTERLTIHREHLGGALASGPIDLVAALDLMLANHRAPLYETRTADLIAQAIGAPTGTGCTFALGFQTLHEALPDVVGACLENEHPDESSGNVVQATRGGLLVYRPTDNWTAFTDGTTTWVSGPFGIQSRPNDERFEWEA